MDDITWQHVLIHVCLWPFYQILSTIRHELSHACAALISGVQVLTIKIWPHRYEGRWYWGRIMYGPNGLENLNVHVHMAPYYVNAICLVTALALSWSGCLARVDEAHWLLFFIVMMIVSPLVDTLYNAAKYWITGTGDFASIEPSDRDG